MPLERSCADFEEAIIVCAELTAMKRCCVNQIHSREVPRTKPSLKHGTHKSQHRSKSAIIRILSDLKHQLSNDEILTLRGIAPPVTAFPLRVIFF